MLSAVSRKQLSGIHRDLIFSMWILPIAIRRYDVPRTNVLGRSFLSLSAQAQAQAGGKEKHSLSQRSQRREVEVEERNVYTTPRRCMPATSA